MHLFQVLTSKTSSTSTWLKRSEKCARSRTSLPLTDRYSFHFLFVVKTTSKPTTSELLAHVTTNLKPCSCVPTSDQEGARAVRTAAAAHGSRRGRAERVGQVDAVARAETGDGKDGAGREAVRHEPEGHAENTGEPCDTTRHTRLFILRPLSNASVKCAYLVVAGIH